MLSRSEVSKAKSRQGSLKERKGSKEDGLVYLRKVHQARPTILQHRADKSLYALTMHVVI